METLLLVAGVTLAVVLALLAMPVELGFSFSLTAPNGPMERSVSLGFAFGLITLRLGGARRRTRAPRPPARPKPAPVRSKRRLRPMRLLADRTARHRLKKFLAHLFQSVHWRSFEFYGRFGLDDPADTGRLWGGIAPLLYGIAPPHFPFDVQPVFTEETLMFRGKGVLWLRPLWVLGVLLGFALAPATWRMIRKAWR